MTLGKGEIGKNLGFHIHKASLDQEGSSEFPIRQTQSLYIKYGPASRNSMFLFLEIVTTEQNFPFPSVKQHTFPAQQPKQLFIQGKIYSGKPAF